jgi:hypothetical protein
MMKNIQRRFPAIPSAPGWPLHKCCLPLAGAIVIARLFEIL